MIDFHSHILPNMDDGAGDVGESLAMLRESFRQGVDMVICTPHFYADQDYPKEFLRRRDAAFQRLRKAMLLSAEAYPQIVLGAEVLYFPGISGAEEIASMTVGSSACILVEPPMAIWSDMMLDEIADMRDTLGLIPVIAHVDRYMNYLNDYTLMQRVNERNMLVQVNADYFLSPKTVKAAVKNLKKGYIQLIGSDCHDTLYRPPVLGLAQKQAKTMGVEAEFEKLRKNAAGIIGVQP